MRRISNSNGKVFIVDRDFLQSTRNSPKDGAPPAWSQMVGDIAGWLRLCPIVRRRIARLGRARKVRRLVASFLDGPLGILLEIAAVEPEAHVNFVGRRVFAAGDREPAAAEPHGDDQSNE